MNLCENIQFHRKRLNLSQEDLGNMLFVSRQTVRMWEKEQTAPSVDNLVRLSEIFSVSVDELLKGDLSPVEAPPREQYSFRFSMEELQEIRRQVERFSGRSGFILFTVGFLTTVFAFVADRASPALAVVIGWLVFCGLTVFSRRVILKKSWDVALPRMAESEYKYVVLADSVEITVFRNEKKTCFFAVPFAEIEKAYSLKHHYALQFSGQQVFLPKADLPQSSRLYAYLKLRFFPDLAKRNPPLWRFFSIFLFILSVASVYLALVLVMLKTGNDNQNIVNNMWLCFLVTPIPMASAAFGFVARRKGRRCKKNIIGGIILTVFLCLFGCCAFLF